MIEQGLELCVKDALTKASHQFHPYDQDITIALQALPLLRSQDNSRNHSYRIRNQSTEIEKPVERLISLLMEHGAPVRDKDIIICMFWGSLSMLNLLMTARPPGKLVLTRKDFNTPSPLADLYRYYYPLDSKWAGYYDSRDFDYGGERVGPLWELGRSQSREFQPMLDFFVDRGEGLNDRCGPGGSLIHALIIKASHFLFSEVHSLEQVSIVIERGADVDNIGPHGTPLAMAWKIIRFANLGPWRQAQLQQIIGLLKRHGANCSWVEPDGTVVSEEEIETLIEASLSDSEDLHLREDKTPGWYNWDILFKDDVDVSEYMESMGTYRPKRPRRPLIG